MIAVILEGKHLRKNTENEASENQRGGFIVFWNVLFVYHEELEGIEIHFPEL